MGFVANRSIRNPLYSPVVSRHSNCPLFFLVNKLKNELLNLNLDFCAAIPRIRICKSICQTYPHHVTQLIGIGHRYQNVSIRFSVTYKEPIRPMLTHSFTGLSTRLNTRKSTRKIEMRLVSQQTNKISQHKGSSFCISLYEPTVVISTIMLETN